MSRVKRWCFTLNHFTAVEYDILFPPTPDGSRGLAPLLEYACVGKEVSTSGTPHLQGFAVFKSRSRLTTVRQLLGRAHWEVARSVAASIAYCCNDGDYVEIGDRPPDTSQGKRTDIESFKSSVQSGVTSRKDLREVHSLVCAQYSKFVEQYIRDQHVPPPVEDFPLRSWQQHMVDIAVSAPDARSIYFVVDSTGNNGKSWLSNWFEANLEKRVQVMKPGKLVDMAFEYDEETELFILDCPRAKQGDYIQYDFLESVKDGRLFSPKYESRTKRFLPPHVFVFMNEVPDCTKLSDDRYVIVNLEDF